MDLTRVRHRGLLCAAALAAAMLCSCSRGAPLIVAVSSPGLRQEIARLAADYSRQTGFRLTLAAAEQAPRDVTIVVGWSFAEAPDPAREAVRHPVPNAVLQKAGFSTALSFERWSRTDTGWNEVPILWDAWGYASSLRQASGADMTFPWKDRATMPGSGQKIAAPGGEPGMRQSLFWLDSGQLPGQDDMIDVLRGGALRRGPAVRASFQSLAAIAQDPVFSAGSAVMMKGDVENLAKNGGVVRLFGSYQWLRGVAGSAQRDFRTFAYPLPQGQGYAVPVSLLTGRVVGPGSTTAPAQDFLAWLASPEIQKDLSQKTGYMAANFNAVNLDANALGARAAAARAARLVPVDPEPMKGGAADSWDALLGRVLARPSEWQRTLEESGTR